MTLTANMVGGYDDNLTAGLGSGTVIVPTAMASGATGDLDARLVYLRRNELRSILMFMGGNLRAYPGYLEHPAGGGVANVDAATKVGQNLKLRVASFFSYEPMFTVVSSAAGSGTPLPEIGDSVPATGLYERRSVNSTTNLQLERNWGRRNSVGIDYAFRVALFTEQDFGDTKSHDVRMEYRRRFAAAAKARGSYRYVAREYIASNGGTVLVPEHRIFGGTDIDKALSRRRSLTLSLEAGAGHLDSSGSPGRQSYDAWVPMGTGRIRLNLSPAWSMEGGYRRDFSLLRGVTNDVYTSDTGYATTGGRLVPRTDIQVGATYSNWRTLIASGVNDTFVVYGAFLQVSFAVTTRVTAGGGYFYYHHRYSNPSVLRAGFPPEYDRHAVRVGLAVRVPVWGTEHEYGGASAGWLPPGR